jgi:uncharacterized protein YbjT (DUF2867 family)
MLPSLLGYQKVCQNDRRSISYLTDWSVAAGDLGKPEILVGAVEGVERVFSLALGPQIGAQEASLDRRRGELERGTS